HGFPPDVFPEVIARINLGQEVEFRDRHGVRTRLWHDPKARRILLEPIDPVPPAPVAPLPPFLCPNARRSCGPGGRARRSRPVRSAVTRPRSAEPGTVREGFPSQLPAVLRLVGDGLALAGAVRVPPLVALQRAGRRG